jgi:hypothetical protein
MHPGLIDGIQYLRWSGETIIWETYILQRLLNDSKAKKTRIVNMLEEIRLEVNFCTSLQKLHRAES